MKQEGTFRREEVYSEIKNWEFQVNTFLLSWRRRKGVISGL